MDQIDFFPLFVIFAVAWLVPLLLSWLEISKVPAVIVIIVMGVVIGPFGFDWVPEREYIDFLAEMGFLFVIFLAGLEIDVDKLINSIPRGKITRIDLISNSLIVANTIYFGSLILAFLAAMLIDYFLEIDIIFYTILFPTVALSVIVPILKADGEMSRKFGQIMLMEGGVATMMSIIFIAVYSGVVKSGFTVELLLFIVIFVVFIIVYLIGKRAIKFNTFNTLLYKLEHAASQIRIRGTVALLLFFVVVAGLINTEPVMGAFFAGMLLSIFVNKERSALLFKLDGMSYGFFIPIFFIMVGVNLEISALSQIQESIIFISILSAAFLFTQVVPSLVMKPVFGTRKSVAGGVLLTARMGLTIAAAQIGISLNIITPAENTGIVASAIIVSLVTPLVYKVLNKEESVKYALFILGGTKASLHLSERIRMHGLEVKTFTDRDEFVQDFKRRDIPVTKVEELNRELVDSLHLRTSDMVVILSGSKEKNVQLAQYIQDELNHHNVITVVKRGELEELRTKTELKIIDTDDVLAKHIEDMVLLPDAVTSVAESFIEYSIEEILMTNDRLHRKQVKEITFPPTGSLVIQRRGNEIFIPHGNTHLLVGDIITVIGNSEALVEFRKILK